MIPPGSAAVGAGLAVSGIAVYGFLIIAARSLSPAEYAAFGVLWSLTFLIGPGLFFPLEQELSRALASRKAAGLGGKAVVRLGLLLGGAVALAFAAAALLFREDLASRLFGAVEILVAALALGVVAYFLLHSGRGVLSGTGRFSAFGLLMSVEGVLRLAGAAALAIAGSRSAAHFGFVLAAAPMIATAIVLSRSRLGAADAAEEPAASFKELSAAFGYLLIASFMAQFLVNAGPIAVQALAEPHEQEVVGPFLSALVMSRAPLYLFFAVQAALLPRLADLNARGLHQEFSRGLFRLGGLIIAGGVVLVAAAALLGPVALEAVFGLEPVLDASDLAMLAGGSVVYMLALTLAQALVARSLHRWCAAGWVAGAVVFLMVTWLQSGLLRRVEQGFLAGAAAAVLVMAALLFPGLRRSGREVSGIPSLQVPIEP